MSDAPDTALEGDRWFRWVLRGFMLAWGVHIFWKLDRFTDRIFAWIFS